MQQSDATPFFGRNINAGDIGRPWWINVEVRTRLQSVRCLWMLTFLWGLFESTSPARSFGSNENLVIV